MNIVDSGGWLEYFAEGPNADFFAGPIEATRSLLVPAICIFEVFENIYKQRGEDAALQAVALMHQGQVVGIDETCILYAAKCSINYDLDMSDSIVLATARLNKAKIWTENINFKDIEDVNYIEAKRKVTIGAR